MPRVRFDPTLLDASEPFEIDTQLSHLFKHAGLSVDDVYDVFFGRPLFYPAKEDGPADWLMVGEVPGGVVLCVPLAPSRTGRPDVARPIGVYQASRRLKDRYLQGR
ncbi:MAG: hypothetical protein WD354_02225 [Acidimicrobiia bacterium]